MLREHHFHFALHKKFVKHRFHLWAGGGAGGWGAGARGLAKRIQFATGYVPALASRLLGRSANKFQGLELNFRVV